MYTLFRRILHYVLVLGLVSTTIYFVQDIGGFSTVVYSQERVWRCDQGYTNVPKGKTGCRPAGAAQICGSDGNRYLSPRKPGEQALANAECASNGDHQSPFVDMSQYSAVKATGAAIYKSLSDSVSGAMKPVTKSVKKLKKDLSIDSLSSKFKLNDMFSCYGPQGDVEQCSMSEFSGRVNESFSEVSDMLK